MYKNYERNCKLMADYHSGDPIKKNMAITELLQSVELFIHKYLQTYRSFLNADNYEDFYQEACMAVVKGLAKYNPEYSLTTFIPNEIKHAIQKYISEMNNITPHYNQRINKIVKTIDKLQSMGIEKPTPKDISSVIGISEKQVIEALQIRDSALVWNYESEEDCSNLFNIHEKSPEEIFEAKETEELLIDALNKLDEIEKCCVLHSFGACGFCKLKSRDIADKYNITVYEVKVKISRALKKLQSNMKNSNMYVAPARKRKVLNSTRIPVFTTPDIEIAINSYDSCLIDEDMEGCEMLELV